MLPQFYSLIGSDRYLTPAEVERAAEPHPQTTAAWDIYTNHFQRVTGATLDPMFHRLSHPAPRTGAVRVESGTSVLVVGTGPSLEPSLDDMRHLAGRVRIFTSPRGAEALLPHGIVPDLVLVEHQTALDAHHSARHLGDASHQVLMNCPLVAADWRTPAALLRNVSPSSLFVPSPLPTWGLWPATAVALAIEAGASRIALVGVDLGTAHAPDPAHAPVAALLGLLARLAPVVALDCGAGGASKRGWMKATLHDAAGVEVHGRCDLHAYAAPAAAERAAAARAALCELAPVIERARAVLALASDARAGSSAGHGSALEAAASEIIDWRSNSRTRVLVQDDLGASFLPRLWRLGIDPSLGSALWRPVLLATHELIHQADALACIVSRSGGPLGPRVERSGGPSGPRSAIERAA